MNRPAPRRVIAIAVGLVAVSCSGSQSVLDPAGPHAQSIARHWWVMLALGTLVLALVVAAFVYAIFGARLQRPRDEPPAEAGDDDASARAKTRNVAIAVGITITILLVVMLQSMLVARQTYAAHVAADLEVEVIGHQWWWEVRYLDPEPARQILSANELHLPVGKSVRVRLRSQDVIHSLWIPNLQGKIDLIPGRANELRLQADQPGTWRGQCAEFCGMQHAKMALAVVAHTPEEFAAWLERERRPAEVPADSLAREGARIFVSQQCAYCHRVRGTDAGGATGPDLTHVGSRLTLAAGTVPNTTGHLGGWILDPQRVKPGSFMPPTPLTGPDLHALLHYLEGLK